MQKNNKIDFYRFNKRQYLQVLKLNSEKLRIINVF